MAAAELPEGILERARQLAELHCSHPTAEMVEAAQLMAQMLHIAVHGDTWARPESPAEVWLNLLSEVSGRRQPAAAVDRYPAGAGVYKFPFPEPITESGHYVVEFDRNGVTDIRRVSA